MLRVPIVEFANRTNTGFMWLYLFNKRIIKDHDFMKLLSSIFENNKIKIMNNGFNFLLNHANQLRYEILIAIIPVSLIKINFKVRTTFLMNLVLKLSSLMYGH